MKKYNIRNFAFLILISVSLLSYTYVSCASINSATAVEVIPTKEVEEAKISLPDVTLMKKLIQLGGKIVAPNL